MSHNWDFYPNRRVLNRHQAATTIISWIGQEISIACSPNHLHLVIYGRSVVATCKLPASQTFQRFIDCVLRGLDFCCAYVDDILIASKNEEEHLRHQEEVFRRLDDYGLVVNLPSSITVLLDESCLRPTLASNASVITQKVAAYLFSRTTSLWLLRWPHTPRSTLSVKSGALSRIEINSLQFPTWRRLRSDSSRATTRGHYIARGSRSRNTSLWWQHPGCLRSIHWRSQTCCSGYPPAKDLRHSTRSSPSVHQSLHSPNHGTFCLEWPTKRCSRVDEVLHPLPNHQGASSQQSTHWHLWCPGCTLPPCPHRSDRSSFPITRAPFAPYLCGSLHFNGVKPSRWSTVTPIPSFSPSCRTWLLDLAHQKLSQPIAVPSLSQRFSPNCVNSWVASASKQPRITQPPTEWLTGLTIYLSSFSASGHLSSRC